MFLQLSRYSFPRFALAVILSICICPGLRTAPAFAAEGSLSGHVSDQLSNGISGVLVQLLTPSEATVIASVATDDSGLYQVTAPAGSYTLRATPPAGSPFRASSVTNVEVGGSSVLNFVLVALGQVVLSGTVRDIAGNPVDGRFVFVSLSSADHGSGTARADADGHYAVTVSSGVYQLAVSGSGTNLPRFDLGANNTINLTADRTQDLFLPTAALTVVVQDADGIPIAGATVGGVPQQVTGFELFPGRDPLAVPLARTVAPLISTVGGRSASSAALSPAQSISPCQTDS
jgi:hypothetical protein